MWLKLVLVLCVVWLIGFGVTGHFGGATTVTLLFLLLSVAGLLYT